ncbi:unnamed protein product [Chironomus riparius]|uniref:Uncharacterized protein n=1 Tax=Chironomus riparius TaxID=315576 RepID=A0A9N9WMI3_9DIPT|nr:unnamed protein product [Chironomus riparius]
MSQLKVLFGLEILQETLIWKPSVITQLIDFVEHKLSLFDNQANFDPEFEKKRCNLVGYLSKRMVNDKSKGEPKNGLAISLLKLYFSSDFFLSEVGWSNYDGRVEIRNNLGHISLLTSLKHTPKEFTPI